MGGRGVRKGLQSYMKNPGNAKTDEEAISMIRNWKLARTRAKGMGLPDVGDLEMRDGLVGIVKNGKYPHWPPVPHSHYDGHSRCKKKGIHHVL